MKKTTLYLHCRQMQVSAISKTKKYLLLFIALLFAQYLLAQVKSTPTGTPVHGIFSISPSSAPSGTVIQINGYGFIGATAVTFGGVPVASFTVVSSQLITAVVGAGATGEVVITVPGGMPDPSLTIFTFLASGAAPIISSFSPSLAETGQTVIIKGANLTWANSIYFGGIKAQSFAVVSDTVVNAVVGNGATGNIIINTSFGADTVTGFTFSNCVTTYSTTIITICSNSLPFLWNGNSYSAAGTYSVTLKNVAGCDSIPSMILKVYPITHDTITLNICSTQLPYKWNGNTYNSSGTYTAHLFSYEGCDSIVTLNLNVQTCVKPVIASFSPTSGPVGTTVVITGTNFSTTAVNNIVYFGAVKAVVISATSTSLSVKVPLGTTYQPITVTTSGLTAYSSQSFTVTFTKADSTFIPVSFADKINFPGVIPEQLAVSDIDGDGKADLLFSSWSYGNVNILRNTSKSGAISFAAGIKINIDINNSYNGNFAIGDFDGDGKPDIVEAASGEVGVVRNTSSVGAISFATPVLIATTDMPQQITVGDLDGDGKPDLVINSSSYLDTIFILKNTSTGPGNISFVSQMALKTCASNHIFINVSNSAYGVAINDLDGDGKPEIIVKGDSICVYKNTSATGVMSFAPRIDFALITQNDNESLAVGDLDGDGKPDIVTTNGILRNISTASSISFAPIVSNNGGGYAVAIGDIDGDGKVDIANSYYDTLISVQRNTSTPGNLSFTSATGYPITASTNGPTWCLCIGDIDCDGRADIEVGNGYKDDNTGQDTQMGSILRNQISKIETWIGTTDSAWENPANWSSGIIPDGNTDVIINAGKVVLSSNTTVKNLTVSAGADFTVATGYKLTITH